MYVPHMEHQRGYDHLAPLLAEFASTATHDPHRARLRDRLVAGYLPLAHNLARRYADRGEPLEDLIQVASIGLLHAVERFDSERGHHFLSFAIPTVTGEIRRHFRDKTWAMRVPRQLKELHLSINSVLVELSQHLGRAPRPSEIAGRLQVPVEDVLQALEAGQSYRADSLDQALSSEAANSNSATLRDTLGTTDTGYDKITDLHSVAPHLAALPTRERDILIMRFYHDMTQTQIAERVGLSQMHVSRLLSTTLRRLREAVDHDAAPHDDRPRDAPRGPARAEGIGSPRPGIAG